MPAYTGKIETVLRDGTLTVEASGSWTIKTASILGASIAKLAPTSGTAASIKFSNLEAIDTAEAHLIKRLYQRLDLSEPLANVHKQHGPSGVKNANQ